jgi:hypothetical protein
MAKAKAEMNNFSSESDIKDLVEKLNSAMSKGKGNLAEVVRDSNGKPVEVHITLPVDISEDDFDKIGDELDKHPAVAKGHLLPKGGMQKFDALTSGSQVISIDVGSPKRKVIVSVAGQFSISAAGEGVPNAPEDGVTVPSKALRLADDDFRVISRPSPNVAAYLGQSSYQTDLIFNSLDVGLNNVKMLECEFDMKVDLSGKDLGDDLVNNDVLGHSFDLSFSANDASGAEVFETHAGMNGARGTNPQLFSVATADGLDPLIATNPNFGVDAPYQKVKLTYIAGHQMTLTMGGVTITKDVSSGNPIQLFRIHTDQADFYAIPKTASFTDAAVFSSFITNNTQVWPSGGPHANEVQFPNIGNLLPANTPIRFVGSSLPGGISAGVTYYSSGGFVGTGLAASSIRILTAPVGQGDPVTITSTGTAPFTIQQAGGASGNPPAPSIPTWDSATSYVGGAVVQKAGEVYLANAPSLNADPAVDPVNWSDLGSVAQLNAQHQVIALKKQPGLLIDNLSIKILG